MNEKLTIAKQLRNSRRSYKNREYRKYCSKCYHAYIVQCIIKRRDGFSVYFGGRYINTFIQRVGDWAKYFMDWFYRLFLICFNPKGETLREYELIHYGVTKPIHVKIAETPDEFILYDYLKTNGFKIEREHLYSESTVYDIVRY